MRTIVIAESDGALSERLRIAALTTECDVVCEDSLESAFERTQAAAPEVLLVGPTLMNDLAFDLAEHLASAGLSETVMVVHEVDASKLRRAMRSGVTEMLSADEPIQELTASLTRALERSSRRGAGTVASTDMPESPKGRVVTVFSTKGGVGKTVLATNIAVSLAKDGARVALLDLDLEFGDVGIMLGIRPEHSIFDALQAFDRLDMEMLHGFMQEHSSGIKVLLAPVRPEDAENISAGRVGRIIDLLQSDFDYVVVDTCPAFSETVLAALDRSSEILVVTMMDVASIKNTRISLQKLRQLGYDNGNVRIVLNRSDSKVLLQPAEVEQAVGGEVTAHIPSDRLVPRCVNKGVPVVIEAPKSPVARSIIALAKLATAAGKEAVDVA